MTGRPAAPQDLLAAGYRVGATVGASVSAAEPGDRSPRSPGGSRGTAGLRGVALERLIARAESEEAAGLCAVRFSTGPPGGAEEGELTVSGLLLGFAGPAWSVERPRVFATTLDPSELAAMLHAGYRPRAVTPLEVRTSRTSAGPSPDGVLTGPDLGARVLLGTLHGAASAAARPHRGDLVLTGAPEIDVRYTAGGPDGGTVEVVARLVADIFRYDQGHQDHPAGPARVPVSLRRPRDPLDPGVLADRVRP